METSQKLFHLKQNKRQKNKIFLYNNIYESIK